jgi:hypothetical protein
METEELGSVYEGLLELTPRLTADGHGFAFAGAGEAKGNARKTSGSYYTPDSLVQALLDSGLDPVLDRVEAEADDPAAALLSVTVLDPACGSGHFLLAAARRIATRVARHRTGGVASAEDYRRALREVARASIHGVDRNPLAVELTKVALWIETVEPGKPLGFLDANIRCGDSLLGVFDLDALRHGIPDAACKPLTGDDKETARYFGQRNKAERAGQGSLDFARGGGRLPAASPLADEARALRAMPEDSPEEIAAKRRRFATGRADPKSWSLQIAADSTPPRSWCRRPRRAGQPQYGDNPDHGACLGRARRPHRLRPVGRPRAGLRRTGARLPLAARIPRRYGGRWLRCSPRQPAVGGDAAQRGRIFCTADAGNCGTGGCRAQEGDCRA